MIINYHNLTIIIIKIITLKNEFSNFNTLHIEPNNIQNASQTSYKHEAIDALSSIIYNSGLIYAFIYFNI